MRIAVIAPTEIPARRANTIQVTKMTQAFTTLGHTTLLVSPFNPSSKEYLNQNKDWDSLAHHYGLKERFPIEWLPAHPFFRSYDYSLRAVNKVRNWGADLIYTRLPQAAAFASLISTPTTLEMHDIPQGKAGPWLFRIFLQGKGAARLVVITQALAKDLEQKFNAPSSKDFTVIAPDGVDLERYTNLPSPGEARNKLLQKEKISYSRMDSPDKFVAGYTGHLYPGRGTSLLLKLASNMPDILFLMVGGEAKDIERIKIEAQQKSLDNLILTGFIPNAELPLYQAACDVLLMPYQEQVAASSGGDIARYLSPMKLFEYLACGRAIISSNLPVLMEILNQQNATLVPPTDEQAWMDALQKVKADPDLRNSLANQARRDARQYT